MTNNFQVGQIVEFQGGEFMAAQKGAKAVVVSLEGYPTFIDVKWIKSPLAFTQMDGGYSPKDFKVVTMAPKKKLQFLHKNKFISNLEYLEALNEAK